MEFIYIEKNSLSENLCKRLIELFNKDEDRYQGITLDGVKLETKNTIDLKINRYKSEEWAEIDDILFKELNKHLKIYFDKLDFFYRTFAKIEDEGFQIQYYKKDEGQYIYHNDADRLNRLNRLRLK